MTHRRSHILTKPTTRILDFLVPIDLTIPQVRQDEHLFRPELESVQFPVLV